MHWHAWHLLIMGRAGQSVHASQQQGCSQASPALRPPLKMVLAFLHASGDQQHGVRAQRAQKRPLQASACSDAALC